MLTVEEIIYDSDYGGYIKHKQKLTPNSNKPSNYSGFMIKSSNIQSQFQKL